jgi:Tol biopolymer transport system component
VSLGLAAATASAQPVILMSKGPAALPADAASQILNFPTNGISTDGRFVVFTSDARNLVAGQVDTNGGRDVFLYDRSTDSVKLVSHRSTDPTPLTPRFAGNGGCKDPVISAVT